METGMKKLGFRNRNSSGSPTGKTSGIMKIECSQLKEISGIIIETK